MTPDKILSHPPTQLSQAQREQYFNDGFLTIPSAISRDWVCKLRELSDQFLDSSRQFSESDDVFDIGPDHSPQTPMFGVCGSLLIVIPIFGPSPVIQC